jgi:hypothetical protein
LQIASAHPISVVGLDGRDGAVSPSHVDVAGEREPQLKIIAERRPRP